MNAFDGSLQQIREAQSIVLALHELRELIGVPVLQADHLMKLLVNSNFGIDSYGNQSLKRQCYQKLCTVAKVPSECWAAFERTLKGKQELAIATVSINYSF